ncbi:MAG: hypothetical protein ACT4RN_22590 [Pseudonocardia sp.]
MPELHRILDDLVEALHHASLVEPVLEPALRADVLVEEPTLERRHLAAHCLLGAQHLRLLCANRDRHDDELFIMLSGLGFVLRRLLELVVTDSAPRRRLHDLCHRILELSVSLEG